MTEVVDEAAWGGEHRGMDAVLLAAVRRRWIEAAGVPVTAFHGVGLKVTAAVGGRTAPAGWSGALSIGGQAMVTAPDARRAQALERVLTTEGITHADQLRAAVTAEALPGVVEVLGPAWLSYAMPATRPVTSASQGGGGARVEVLESSRANDLQALLRVCSTDEVAESAVEELTELRVVRDEEGVVVAAAGWETWPGGVAHVGVLAAPSVRGHGTAASVAGAAVGAASSRGLVVQWRARPSASRRLARRLGLVEVGWQLSWR